MISATGAKGKYFSTDGPTADDVGGGVADDKHFRSGEFVADQHFAAGESDFGEFISVFVIIAESADAKLMPEIKMAQFDFGAEPDIAGQESHDGPRCKHRKVIKKLLNTGANSTRGVAEVLVQEEHVTSEKAFEVCRRGLDAVGIEELAHERCVCSTGKTHVSGTIANAELEFTCAIKRTNTRAAGADQSAVDVEQYQPDHAWQATGWFGPEQARLPGLIWVPPNCGNPTTSPDQDTQDLLLVRFSGFRAECLLSDDELWIITV